MKRRAVIPVGLAVAAAAVPAGIAVARPDQGRSVNVRMSEFRFQGPVPLSAGRTTFRIRNAGAFPHNFTVVYATPGNRKFASRTLKPGQTQRLTVRLKPGAYVAICTVGNGFHASRGMIKRFSIGKFDPTTGKWSAS